MTKFVKSILNDREYSILIVVYFLCIFIFSIRNLEPLLFPTLYAEDGVWLGKLMQSGFWETAFHAREGFPVFGLVGLDWLALKLDILFSKRQIFDLPFYVWVVSISFLSFVSIFPLIAFRQIFSLRYRLSMSFILPLMPVGASGNEIYGRIGNLVFLFPLICVYSICLLRSSAFNPIKFVICLLIVVVSNLTFPVCLGISFLWLAIEVFLILSQNSKALDFKVLDGLEGLGWSYVVAIAFVFFSCIYLMPSDLLTFAGGGAGLVSNPAGWIDFVGARMILYPIVSSFYHSMTNSTTIIGATLIGGFILLGLFAKNDSKAKFTNLFLVGSLVLYLVATAIMRSGFTSFFGEFKNTFPDRYFMGINVLFMLALHSVLYQIQGLRKNSLRVIWIILTINIIILHNRIFEVASPAMNWRDFGDFRHMTCMIASESVPLNVAERSNLVVAYKADFVEFPIYPKIENLGWRMGVPSSIFENSIKTGCYGYSIVGK